MNFWARHAWRPTCSSRTVAPSCPFALLFSLPRLLSVVLLAAWCMVTWCDAASSGGGMAAEVCESKTINYITHTLPQQCLPTSWTLAPRPASATRTEQVEAASTSSAAWARVGDDATDSVRGNALQPGGGAAAYQTQAETRSGEREARGGGGKAEDAKLAAEEAADGQDLATGTFMSFEEWKEMMLRKSGQDDLAEIKKQKQRDSRPGGGGGGDRGDDLDSIGDGGEIGLDLDALAEKVSALTRSGAGVGDGRGAGSHAEAKKVNDDPVLYYDGKTQYYRSKDAGKTCKERFSYASFDAGATVLKTSAGAKNAKAILVENKDSYMLLECHAKNKFVIVELSDDILVDTVVLANFEFFSSMIRTFRVSVSDRYPVKLDKWVDLGTFETKNSRDIQAFLVEQPQIYTKYLRIEFLSHYGNEYYCPASLLRVHGTRMLDSWKEPDTSDDLEDVLDLPAQEPPQEPEARPSESALEAGTRKKASDQHIHDTAFSPAQAVFYQDWLLGTCRIASPTTADPAPVISAPGNDSLAFHGDDAPVPAPNSAAADKRGGPAPSSSASSKTRASPLPHIVSEPMLTPTPTSTAAASGAHTKTDAADEKVTSQPWQQKAGTSATAARNKTSTPSFSSAASSPTVQESFFKQIAKRLQHLESNTSLSMQYIEEQSRFLQEALLKMEKKQMVRVDAFLDGLNRTVLGELRSVRTQYDQIWQSTVLALEQQRDQADREIVALTSRLNVLANEMVFQKRMAVWQSLVLLVCLVLVVFSRGFDVASALDLALHTGGNLGQSLRGSMSTPALEPVSPSLPSAGADYSTEPEGADTPTSASAQPLSSPVPDRALQDDQDRLLRCLPSYRDSIVPQIPTDQPTCPSSPRKRERKPPTPPVIHVQAEEETTGLEDATRGDSDSISHSIARRSKTSQLGGLIMPLPALSEDPT